MRTIANKTARSHQADKSISDEPLVDACWPAFLRCLRAVAASGNNTTTTQRLPQLQGVPEFLLDLLPRVDLSVGSDVTRCVDLLLRISMQQRSVDSGGEVYRWVNLRSILEPDP